jgi:hypothetical protein
LYTTLYIYSVLYTTLYVYSVLYTTLYIYSVLYTTLYVYSVLYTTLYIYRLLYTTLYVYSVLYTTLYIYSVISHFLVRMKVRDCDVLAQTSTYDKAMTFFLGSSSLHEWKIRSCYTNWQSPCTIFFLFPSYSEFSLSH